jgi:hypothetical protein
MKIFLGSRDDSIFLLFEKIFKTSIEKGTYDFTYGNYFDDNSYNLIIADESIENQVDTKEIPVIILTSQYKTNTENIFYVHKPIQIDEIKEYIKNVYDNIQLAKYMEVMLEKKSPLLIPFIQDTMQEDNFNRIWTNVTGKKEDLNKIKKMLTNFTKTNYIPENVLEKSRLILEEFLSTILDTADDFKVGLCTQKQQIVLEIDGIKEPNLFFIKNADYAQFQTANKRNKLSVYWDL